MKSASSASAASAAASYTTTPRRWRSVTPARRSSRHSCLRSRSSRWWFVAILLLLLLSSSSTNTPTGLDGTPLLTDFEERFDNEQWASSSSKIPKLFVSQLMQPAPDPPITPSTPLRSALVTFLGEDTSGLPVVDPTTNEVVGVVSLTDVLWRELKDSSGSSRKSDNLMSKWSEDIMVGSVDEDDIADLLSEDRFNSCLSDAPASAREAASFLEGLVDEAMTSPAIVVTEDATISEAAADMVNNGIVRLPVVSRKDGKTLVGMVTRFEIMKLMAATLVDIPECLL
ncbi:hypothetical protein NFJ02_14g17380 [Pycnococcus provasolii]